MHQHVRIASDGRSEMGVIIECQSVVTDVVHGIACFLHGTDGYGFNKVLLFLSLNIIQQMVDGFGYIRFGSAGAQFVAEAGNELCQIIQFFRVRKVVNTIGEYFRLFAFGHASYLFGHSAVGE